MPVLGALAAAGCDTPLMAAEAAEEMEEVAPAAVKDNEGFANTGVWRAGKVRQQREVHTNCIMHLPHGRLWRRQLGLGLVLLLSLLPSLLLLRHVLLLLPLVLVLGPGLVLGLLQVLEGLKCSPGTQSALSCTAPNHRVKRAGTHHHILMPLKHLPLAHAPVPAPTAANERVAFGATEPRQPRTGRAASGTSTSGQGESIDHHDSTGGEQREAGMEATGAAPCLHVHLDATCAGLPLHKLLPLQPPLQRSLARAPTAHQQQLGAQQLLMPLATGEQLAQEGLAVASPLPRSPLPLVQQLALVLPPALLAALVVSCLPVPSCIARCLHMSS